MAVTRYLRYRSIVNCVTKLRFCVDGGIMANARTSSTSAPFNVDIGGTIENKLKIQDENKLRGIPYEFSRKKNPKKVGKSAMRIKYNDKADTFTEDQLESKEPFGQFKAWFEVASKTPGIQEPNAMCLGTATKDGIPSVRPVLLKGFSSEGFKFYTNYESRKGRELAANPNAALTFYWEPLRRTVRIEGRVEKTSAEDSDNYFKSRPFASQIGAHASKQSNVIAGRESLMVKERELLANFTDGNVKRPECWGGFLVVPKSVEFWQGQSDRLHDRIRFRRLRTQEKVDNILVHQGIDGWVYERLSP